jgi:hypothetical protein
MMSWPMLGLPSAVSRMISIHSASASPFRGTRPELASTVQSARPRPEYEIGLEGPEEVEETTKCVLLLGKSRTITWYSKELAKVCLNTEVHIPKEQVWY